MKSRSKVLISATKNSCRNLWQVVVQLKTLLLMVFCLCRLDTVIGKCFVLFLQSQNISCIQCLVTKATLFYNALLFAINNSAYLCALSCKYVTSAI